VRLQHDRISTLAEGYAMKEAIRTLDRIERQLKSIGGDLHTVAHALLGIYEVLKESNRARDKWARAVVDVFEDAKEGQNADEDGG
jgi:hypothetical protein